MAEPDAPRPEPGELDEDLAAFAPTLTPYRFKDPKGDKHEVGVLAYVDLPWADALRLLRLEQEMVAGGAPERTFEILREQTRLLCPDAPDAVLDRLSRRQMFEVARVSVGLPPRPPAASDATPFAANGTVSASGTSSPASLASTAGATTDS